MIIKSLVEAKMNDEEKVLKKKIILRLKAAKRSDLAAAVDTANVNLTNSSTIKGYYNDANNTFIFNSDLNLNQIIEDLLQSAPDLKKVPIAKKEEPKKEENKSLDEAKDSDETLTIKDIRNWSDADFAKAFDIMQEF